MPKTPERIARDLERAARERAEARFDHQRPIGPDWPYRESPLARQARERKAAERRAEQAARPRFGKPTSTAHFHPGRYESSIWRSTHYCRDCAQGGFTDRWIHDRWHDRQHARVTQLPLMFLETLEELFGPADPGPTDAPREPED